MELQLHSVLFCLLQQAVPGQMVSLPALLVQEVVGTMRLHWEEQVTPISELPSVRIQRGLFIC